MINIDFECGNGHRFEGCFSDYRSFVSQHDSKMIMCPLCDTHNIRRVYSGCSIHARGQSGAGSSEKQVPFFELMRGINTFVRNNFDDEGTDFADTVRRMHYGITEGRNVYGRSSIEELKELSEEGIPVMPLPDFDKFSN